MSNRGVLALDSAACRTQEKLDIFAITYARVVNHPHRCAWDVFLVESQVAKFTSGMQQIVESVCGSQAFRLHTYQSTPNLNGGILLLDFNLGCLHISHKLANFLIPVSGSQGYTSENPNPKGSLV